jgi:hypothetical protein
MFVYYVHKQIDNELNAGLYARMVGDQLAAEEHEHALAVVEILGDIHVFGAI